LGNNILVAEGSHERMGISMDGDIISCLKSLQELTPVLENVETNHEMSGMDVFLLQKRDKCVCGLTYIFNNHSVKSAYILTGWGPSSKELA